mgnify:CR=1 FL=1
MDKTRYSTAAALCPVRSKASKLWLLPYEDVNCNGSALKNK